MTCVIWTNFAKKRNQSRFLLKYFRCIIAYCMLHIPTYYHVLRQLISKNHNLRPTKFVRKVLHIGWISSFCGHPLWSGISLSILFSKFSAVHFVCISRYCYTTVCDTFIRTQCLHIKKYNFKFLDYAWKH